ncbi:CinA family nicotinamide mononucleotide deamidase-related protein [Oceanospirillum beijerinckii]|uniref:CinA family nicotinamide mononucleotide deamidase-related protein n=1 Tax=Oceanospirillum beijerinckii TaxID=64976 RepID=UPI00042576AC|nr:CinA family nicotinamide mononucleotide deamidase-related protein [Oceanospirillum beijerinckii]
MNIQLLMTGNELMSGDIIDSNSAMIADQLQPLGITVTRRVTVGDNLQQLVGEIQYISQSADLLIVNGGLGPTTDDMTSQALALATGTELVENAEALAHLTQWCEQRNAQLNAANLKQTILPEGCEVVPNPRGTAVGFQMPLNDCLVVCTPGVPSELKVMLQQTIIPALQNLVNPDNACVRDRFHTFGLGESRLQQLIADQIPDWPKQLELGFRAGAPTLEVKVQSAQRDNALHQEYVDKLTQLLQDNITSSGSESQAQALVKLLTEQQKKITCVESCTGGLIASMITSVPGSSAVFEAGFVTYSNAQKTAMVGVNETTLIENGAVSEQTVREMAAGGLEKAEADYVIAVSGIAGPDGGSDDKPVGTVWIAWGDHEQIDAARLYLPYHRKLFQTMVAGTGLDLIRRKLQGVEQPANYLTERVHPSWK